MFISINHIPVKPGRESEFEELFRQREKAVEKQPGFISLDVLKPGQKMIMGQSVESTTHEYQVLTRWENEQAFVEWVHSEDFKRAHSRQKDTTMFDGKSHLTLHGTIDGAGA